MTAAGSLRLGAGRLLGERPQPAYGRSFALAFAIHAMLIAVLFVGVRFQSSAPDTVTVELWEAPPAPRVAEPPPPPPPPKPAPEPPKPVPEPPKPEPKVEKPEIVEKAAPKPKPKPEPKPRPKPEPKPKPPARDLEFEKRMREQLAQEQASLREQQAREAAAREQQARQAAARNRALADWQAKIRAKIRGRILEPVASAVPGNPEAVFEVSLLPTGEVLTVTMRKSSGNKPYDDELMRAIQAASPLPKPDPASLFQRTLELRFRPKDQQ